MASRTPRRLFSRPFAALLLVATLAGAPGCGGGATDRTLPPNIILILADDLGYNDLGCYFTPDSTGTGRITTPNIDRLAREGLRFTEFYAAAPVCTPSRAGLLTGCYPPRVGLSETDTPGGLVLTGRSKIGLNPDEITMAEMLAARGYATACIGKWHLGHRPPFLPTRQGFDFFYGPMFRNRQRPDADVMRGEKIAETVRHEDLSRRYTDEAIAFMRRNKNRPFFIYLPESMPHPPLAVEKVFEGKSKRGFYGDVIMSLDFHVGRLIQELRREKIDRRTLVIFTSDNGPELDYGPLGSAFPLRGGKLDCYEGGFRVPCILWWPGTIPAGRTVEQVCAMMDFYPTVARLAGAALPDTPLDGVDIGGLLRDPGQRSPRGEFCYFDKNQLRALRQGPWKLIFAHPDASGANTPAGLYNLEVDPGERDNVIGRYHDVVKELTSAADRVRADLGDELTGQPGAHRRPPGRWEPPAP